MHYILDENKQPVLVEDPIEWAKWFETAERRVVQEHIGRWYFSTVFLGLDHAFSILNSPPILFETMLFAPFRGDCQRRYCTWDEAVVGHEQTVWITCMVLAYRKRHRRRFKVRGEVPRRSLRDSQAL